MRKRRVNGKSALDNREVLLTRPTGFADFAEKNFTYILIGAIAIIVIIIGAFVWSYMDNKREATAAEQFSQSVARYEQILAEDGKVEEVLEQFQSINREYGETGSGVLSLYYAGNCSYMLKNYDEAIVSFERFIKEVPKETHLRILAFDSLGYCYEQKGDYAKAIDYYEKTVNPAPGLGEAGYLNLARCYEALDDAENSLKYYQRIILEYPESRMAIYIQEKIKLLENKHSDIQQSAVPEAAETVSEETVEE